MPLIHQQSDEPRYDADTLRKVTALAQRIQARQDETVTAGEMEDIGAEVGLDRSVVRQALGQITSSGRSTLQKAPSRISPELAKSLVAAWWAAGWCLPVFMIIAAKSVLKSGDLGAAISMLGWGIYIAGGIVMSSVFRPEDQAKAAEKNAKREVSRADLLDALFTLQHALDVQKQHRAFLSVDVVASSEMKRGQDELAVEYSFGQLQSWIGDTARAYGGEMHSAAGDGMMCTFRDDAAALRAARALQEGMEHFNRGRNRLPQPFRIRCGLSAGEVAVDPRVSVGQMHGPVIDRAAHLQKLAQPGDIVVSGELAAVGLLELGRLAPAATPSTGEPAFSWAAATPA